MTLKDQIEKRVIDLTIKPQYRARRVVLFLHENTEEYRKIEDYVGLYISGIDYVCFEGESNIVSILKRQLDIYSERKSDREIDCSEGVYVLIGSNEIGNWSEEIINNLYEASRCFDGKVSIECCITSPSPVGIWDCPALKKNISIWVIDKGNPLEIQFLVENAQCSDELLSAKIKEIWRDTPYLLKVEESNEIREKISQTFLEALSKQTSKRDSIEKEISDYLVRADYLKQIKESIPKIQWLPILGHEQVQEMLMDEFRSFPKRERIARFFDKKERRSDYTVEQIIDALFGRNGEIVRTESILTSIEGILPDICKRVMDQYQAAVKADIFERFSVYEIYYALKDTLWEMQQKVREQIEDGKRKMRGLLSAKFTYHSTEIEDLFAGLEEYFSAFSRHCDYLVREKWLESLGQYVERRECRQEARDILQGFNNATIVFRNSLIDINGTMSVGNEKKVNFHDMISMSEELSHFSVNAVLTKEEICRIIRVKDQKYGSTSDLNVKEDKRPKVFLFASRDCILDDKYEDNFNFQWFICAEDYLPSQLSYQVRVYNNW